GSFTAVNGAGRNFVARLEDTFRTNVNTLVTFSLGSAAGANAGGIVTNITATNFYGTNFTFMTNFTGTTTNINFGVNFTSTNQVGPLAGKLYVGGSFTNLTNLVSGAAANPRNGIVRLNADGTLDTSFVPATGVGTTNLMVVRTLAVQSNGLVLVGGNFTNFTTNVVGIGVSNISGTNVGITLTEPGGPRTNVARLNLDGSVDLSFNTTNAVGTNVMGSVNVVLLQTNGQVLIGGAFTNNTATNLVRVNGDGTLDATFQSQLALTNGFINALALWTNGAVLGGGAFTNTNGVVTATNLARWNATNGVLDTAFGAAAGTNVVGGRVTAVL